MSMDMTNVYILLHALVMFCFLGVLPFCLLLIGVLVYILFRSAKDEGASNQ